MADNNNQLPDEESDRLLENAHDFNKTEFSTVEWDDKRFVWDISQLEQLNKEFKKAGEPEIEIVKKHSEVDLGIRAHREMTFGKCLISIFMIDHNEFIFIWLYLGFAIYFWVQFGFLVAHDDSYGYKRENYYFFMAWATFVLALSLTVSVIYLIFYSISKYWERALNRLDVSVRYTNIYSLLLTFIVAEYSTTTYALGSGVSLMEFYIYLTLFISLVTIILIQYESFRTVIWWVTFGYVVIIAIADQFLCSGDVFDAFWFPLLILSVILALVGIFYFF